MKNLVKDVIIVNFTHKKYFPNKTKMQIITKRTIMKKYIQKHQIVFYYCTAFALGWIPIFLITGSPAYSAPIPLIVAFALKWFLNGKLGLKELSRLCFSVRIPRRIWTLSLFVPLVLTLIPMLIFGFIRGAWPEFAYLDKFLPLIVSLLFWFTPLSGGFLELGFQSFALPILEKRFGPLIGATIVGFFLGSFMLPDFFRAGSPQAQMGNNFILWFILSEIGIAYMIAYLCNKSNGKVFAGGYIFHVMNNVFISLFLVEQGVINGSFDQILLWLIAGTYILGGLFTVIVTKGRLGFDKE